MRIQIDESLPEGLKQLLEINKGNFETICESIKNKGENKGESKAWTQTNSDIPENTKFQDLVESLKVTKKIKGLTKYIGENNLPMLTCRGTKVGISDIDSEEEIWKN